MRIGEKRQDFDREDFLSRFADLIIRHQDMNVGQIEVGTIVFEVAQIAGDAGIRLPTELTMLGKTLLNLDQVGRTLDPEVRSQRFNTELMPFKLPVGVS